MIVNDRFLQWKSISEIFFTAKAFRLLFFSGFKNTNIERFVFVIPLQEENIWGREK